MNVPMNQAKERTAVLWITQTLITMEFAILGYLKRICLRNLKMYVLVLTSVLHNQVQPLIWGVQKIIQILMAMVFAILGYLRRTN